MKVSRRIVLLFLVLVGITALVGAQTGQTRELSVEESYLQQSVEMMIIREQSRAQDRSMKLVALQYIDDAIASGNTSDDIRASLEYLGIEGTINQTRENGRLINNYPDIRREAAKRLGQLGTKEAHDSLIKMLLADDETMVLQEVVNSLATIGLSDGNEAMNAIYWTFRGFDAKNPDNLLALSALDAALLLSQANNSVSDAANNIIMMVLANASYTSTVQQHARDVLNSLRRLSVQQQ